MKTHSPLNRCCCPIRSGAGQAAGTLPRPQLEIPDQIAQAFAGSHEAAAVTAFDEAIDSATHSAAPPRQPSNRTGCAKPVGARTGFGGRDARETDSARADASTIAACRHGRPLIEDCDSGLSTKHSLQRGCCVAASSEATFDTGLFRRPCGGLGLALPAGHRISAPRVGDRTGLISRMTSRLQGQQANVAA